MSLDVASLKHYSFSVLWYHYKVANISYNMLKCLPYISSEFSEFKFIKQPINVGLLSLMVFILYSLTQGSLALFVALSQLHDVENFRKILKIH